MPTSPNSTTDIDIDRLLRLQDVKSLTGLSRTTLYEAMRRPAWQGGFPRPIKVRRISAWPESEVRDWIEARKQERLAAQTLIL
ncbi:helix-turn-helix transcriptional regulator [Pararhodobacter oceanensis]|uniref:AlpA family transcriptional regulator n=1 Tax=Pararhodobacter oceanensis TaxID=2172121 RepID=A0A2T8HY35_9RHOB|nr:AlpA family phage regulatory protein [Pararhodobacter oceanensis]PVH30327.1 AlpA family transcriptional regulator [Pararhodobacter oceanensis]